MITFLAESLPQQIRSGGIGIIYAVAITVFGGSASFVVAWLTEVTGSPLAPAWYMCAALVHVAVWRHDSAVRETAPVKDWRVIALSCQRRSSARSSNRQPGKDQNAGCGQQGELRQTAWRSPAGCRIPQSPKPGPWAVPEPATNPPATAPIKASPPAVFMPDS
jgi:hypothetical protein